MNTGTPIHIQSEGGAFCIQKLMNTPIHIQSKGGAFCIQKSSPDSIEESDNQLIYCSLPVSSNHFIFTSISVFCQSYFLVLKYFIRSTNHDQI